MENNKSNPSGEIKRGSFSVGSIDNSELNILLQNQQTNNDSNNSSNNNSNNSKD